MNKAQRRSLLALCMTVVFAGSSLTACTPRPDTADPIAQEFLHAWAEQDFDTISTITDQAELATDMLSKSFDGLQAESVELTLDSVDSRDTIATAHFSVVWKLPRDREISYDSAMTLTKMRNEWTVRWEPSLVHPKLGATQHLELRAIEAQRANVISSDGAPVLAPGSIFRVLVDPTAGDSEVVVKRVAEYLEAAHAQDAQVRTIDVEDTLNNLGDSTYSLTTVDANVGARMQQDLAGLPGLNFNEEAAMVATDPGFAPDIVSRVSRIVDEELDGSNGWRASIVTSNGAVIDDIAYHAPELAPSVKISLDHNVQRAAEEAVELRADMKTMMVVMRPSTGEILAVAQTNEADKDGDMALMGQYPPGSTFKIITAAAGLMHENLSPDTIVPCPGTMNIFGRIVTNYNSFSLGNTSLDNAFANSCNTTFADISTNLAPGQLKNVAKQFGLGIDYQIPGLDTMTGSVPEGDITLDRTESGYGQGLDLASPFGMALVAATAATGAAPIPTLIAGHETTTSEEVPPLEPEVLANVQRMMKSVVNDGTARGMRQTGGQIYAKTGEAEINEGSHAWFTGYREDDLAFATLVVLGGGSETATAVTDQFFVRLDELRAGGDIAVSTEEELIG
ncbi:penicillin-binding transpeptidase domain-containing protein [Corynebacterium crudilactis]|uniref:Cell division protein FtsI n=1 Tax=Corynebacterium crudilactis TaxID=1652495 RepID=A0A172QUF5_9CORY|nr:penicillin-binding transpeptidase domain-containing protein [Corynebacterium crudilactis]ANE04281.1 cell division protein FtsI [Corynebacterium crudilactis]